MATGGGGGGMVNHGYIFIRYQLPQSTEQMTASLPRGGTYAQYLDLFSKEFSCRIGALKYSDEDGDLVHVWTEQEFTQMIAFYDWQQKDPRNPTPITIFPQPAEEAPRQRNVMDLTIEVTPTTVE